MSSTYLDKTTYGKYVPPMDTQQNMISLFDLSEVTGVEARTLRSWVADGLLSPPDKAGRGAMYPATNIDRVRAVLALKGKHSMTEIASMFRTANAEQIRGWALGEVEEGTTRSPLLDFTRAIKPQMMGTKGSEFGKPKSQVLSSASDDDPLTLSLMMKHPDVNPGELAALERLLLQLDQLVNGSFSKRVRGETWTRLAVTRDIELSIRGPLRPDELKQFELLAGQLRTILTGRISHE